MFGLDIISKASSLVPIYPFGIDKGFEINLLPSEDEKILSS
jgi:hypothetical protein